MKIRINENQYTKLFSSRKKKVTVDEMRVFHGSGARFNQFNSDFNSSGEGSNCFGPGHYFTNSKQIGIDYAKEHGTRESKIPNIHLKNNNSFNAHNQAPLLFSKLSKFIPLNWDGDFKIETLIDYMNNCTTKEEFIHKVYFHLVKAMKSIDDYEEFKDWYADKLNQALVFLKNNVEVSERSLYQVEIPNEGYAEWSDTVPQEVLDTVNDYINNSKNDRAIKNWSKFLDRVKHPLTFEEMYNGLNCVDYEATFGDNVFKRAMKRHNYVGITYDAGLNFSTSSTKKGDKNFTVFDDNNTKITKRWDL